MIGQIGASEMPEFVQLFVAPMNFSLWFGDIFTASVAESQDS